MFFRIYCHCISEKSCKLQNLRRSFRSTHSEMTAKLVYSTTSGLDAFPDSCWFITMVPSLSQGNRIWFAAKDGGAILRLSFFAPFLASRGLCRRSARRTWANHDHNREKCAACYWSQRPRAPARPAQVPGQSRTRRHEPETRPAGPIRMGPGPHEAKARPASIAAPMHECAVLGRR